MVGRAELAWQPTGRNRVVSRALTVYAALATNAAEGAWRDPDAVRKPVRKPAEDATH